MTLPSPSVPAKTAPPLCVLVVDDFRDAADTLAQLLSLLGHDAHTAYDAKTALQKAADLRPQVVLLDLNLAGTDGCDESVKNTPHGLSPRFGGADGIVWAPT